MSLLPIESPRFEEANKVIELYIANVGPFAIAKQLGIRKVDVDAHIEDWRKSAVGSEIMKDRVEELIATLDAHYSKLIQKAYEIIEEVDSVYTEEEEERESKRHGRQTMTRSQMLSQKLGALKAIADFEAKRIDVLQKSGLLEAADVGDALVEMEMKYEEVMTLLEEHLCDSCHTKILGALAAKGGVVVSSG